MVKNKSKIIIALVVICLLLTAYSGVEAQIKRKKKTQPESQSLPSFREETYEEVIELLMPKTVALEDDVEAAMTIRVAPSFEPDRQYILIKKKSGAVEVIKREMKSNINYRMFEIVKKTPDLTAAEFVKKMTMVEKRETISAAKFEELRVSLSVAAAEHQMLKEAGRFPHGILDGTSYLIWSADEIRFEAEVHSGMVTKAPESKESPLLTWVKNLQKEIGL